MIAVLARARVWVVVVALSVVLVSVDVQAQSEVQRSPRGSRAVSMSAQNHGLSAQERQALNRCTRFMRMNNTLLFDNERSFDSAQLGRSVIRTPSFYQAACELIDFANIFANDERTADYGQCVIFLKEYERFERSNSLSICSQPQYISIYADETDRSSFQRCMLYASRYGYVGGGAFGNPADECSRAELISIYSNLSDARAYEACAEALADGSEINLAVISYNCLDSERRFFSIFRDQALVNRYNSCLSSLPGRTEQRRIFFDILDCLSIVKRYQTYVHANPAQLQAYDVCKSIGNSAEFCLRAAQGDYERELPREQQSATGAGD